MKTLKFVYARAEVIVEWNEERRTARAEAIYNRDVVIALLVVDYEMKGVGRVSAAENRR